MYDEYTGEIGKWTSPFDNFPCWQQNVIMFTQITLAQNNTRSLVSCGLVPSANMHSFNPY